MASPPPSTAALPSSWRRVSPGGRRPQYAASGRLPSGPLISRGGRTRPQGGAGLARPPSACTLARRRRVEGSRALPREHRSRRGCRGRSRGACRQDGLGRTGRGRQSPVDRCSAQAGLAASWPSRFSGQGDWRRQSASRRYRTWSGPCGSGQTNHSPAPDRGDGSRSWQPHHHCRSRPCSRAETRSRHWSRRPRCGCGPGGWSLAEARSPRGEL